MQQAAVAPAPTAVQEEKKEESRRSPEIVDKSKHGVAAAADARAKEADTATPTANAMKSKIIFSFIFIRPDQD